MFSNIYPWPLHRLSLGLALALTHSVWAQQMPDAGRSLQEQQTVPQQPHLPKTHVQLPPAVASIKMAGGVQVRIDSVEFSGHTLFDDRVLQTVVEPLGQQTFDLAGLQTLAEKIEVFYRQSGYPFTRAFLPQQELTDGKLRIQVLEGRYGEIRVSGDTDFAVQAQAFLSPLQPGQLIHSGQLEHRVGLLSDLPGWVVSTVMRPGQAEGSGDLDVRAERGRRFSGEVGLDNHGNRFTGENGVRTHLQWHSPFLLGDQATLQGVYTDEGLWFGNLDYSVPLGSSGWRGNVAYAKNQYQLAKDFESLNATGSAQVTTVGMSYPLWRSPHANWTFAASYQRKNLNDRRAAVGLDERKSVDAWPLALQFDVRDASGGGLIYGSVALTPGQLHLDGDLESADQASGREAHGHFNKLNLNIARLQTTVWDGFTLWGRLTAQWSDRNLDSSEKMSLGGSNGVRAYPVGEGLGDQGWLAQIEVRYALGACSPFAFYDAGRVQFNAQTASMTPAVTDNHRSLAGAGLGARYREGPWEGELAVAWRALGGAPQADAVRGDPRVWFKLGYRF